MRNICILATITAAVVLTLRSAEFKDEKIPPSLAAVPSLLAENEIRVHFIDLGQADGILLQSAQNAVLIDGGEYATRDTLVNYLRNAGITTLDYVVATHPHSDHIGGLAAVIQQFYVKNVLMPDATNNTATFEKLLTAIENKGISITVPSVGDKITAGIIKFTVLAPAKDFKDLNNASLVLRMAHGETAFLFTGDAETLSEKEMLNSGLNLRANVLKAGHHGSRTSTSSEFLDAVRPGTVVVSCGTGNSYGHPHKEFLEIVSQPERNITLLRTDKLGTIIITTNGQEIKLYVKGEES
jgi:competence protein ComEC